ncbi:hypothetical protein G6F46_015670 [Rhizopus delemar]|nr:hypothetical protein G6F46_015670 [Rhizopus delemar]
MRNQPPVRGTALLEPVRVRRPAQHADGARHRAALQEQVAARLAHGDVRRQVTVSAGQPGLRCAMAASRRIVQ